MAKRTVPYEDILYRDLQDPEEAAAYLTAALDDKSRKGSDVFLLALRDVAKARGIRQLAQDTQLSRESLYRTLSRKGNPRFSTLEAVLESLGLKLSVEVRMEPGFPGGEQAQGREPLHRPDRKKRGAFVEDALRAKLVAPTRQEKPFKLVLKTVRGSSPPNAGISDRDALYDMIDRE